MSDANAEAEEQGMMARRRFLGRMAALSLWPLAGTAVQASEQDRTPVPGGFQNWVAQDDPNYWSWIRQQFLIPADEAYFNTGTLGACPRQVLNAVVASMEDVEKTIAHYDYRAVHPEYIAGYRPQLDLRKKAGVILNASAAEIALVKNATMGLNFIANGLELKPGDEVLITDQEHPGAQGPWELRARREGIVVTKVVIPVPTPDPETILKAFTAAIGPRTRVLAIPHITSRYGIVLPVRELCGLGRARGLFTLVDGAQGPGQLRVDVKKIDCDAYACSPHKWLLAPPGNGLLYVRQERQKEIWATLASASWDDYKPEDGIYRLMQFGTGNEALLVGLEAALDFHLRIGAEKVERRILGLADSLRGGLCAIKGVTIASPLHPALAGAIVSYGVAGLSADELMDGLWNRKKIRVRSEGSGLVRQSVHFYNSPAEIEATLGVVRLLAAK